MPKENIERAIKKGTGELEGVDYQEVHVRGLRPGRRRADDPGAHRQLRRARSPRSAHKLSRGGGNLGATNSVSWMFERKGQIYVDAARYDEDALMEAALEAGADGLRARGRPVHRDARTPTDFHAVKAALEGEGHRRRRGRDRDGSRRTPCASRARTPKSLLKLLETIEELDDVQKVDANFDMDVAEMASRRAAS